jgi:hypothetical protein
MEAKAWLLITLPKCKTPMPTGCKSLTRVVTPQMRHQCQWCKAPKPTMQITDVHCNIYFIIFTMILNLSKTTISLISTGLILFFFGSVLIFLNRINRIVQNISNKFILLDINKDYNKDNPNIFIFYRFYLVFYFIFQLFISSINFYNF